MNENLASWDMKDEIYLDNAATTPVDPVVKKEMDKYFSEDYGNPGSFNSVGLRIRLIVDESRQKIYNEIKTSYDKQSDPKYAAARLWIDEIIMPTETRRILIESLDVVKNEGEIKNATYGALQV